MRWIDKIERKYGKYAIPNLMYYIIILYALGFVVEVASPDLYDQYLALDAQAILHGQIWRIFTFIIQPPTGSFIFIFFSLYLYYMIGKMLEYQWGAFKFNLYFFSGLFLHVLVSIGIYLVTGLNFSYGTMYLNMSLFFAFAALFPDVQFLLFFIIPIKCKWAGICERTVFCHNHYCRICGANGKPQLVCAAEFWNSGSAVQQRGSSGFFSELYYFLSDD